MPGISEQTERRSGSTSRRGLLGTSAAAAGLAGCGTDERSPQTDAATAEPSPVATSATASPTHAAQTETPSDGGAHVYDTAGRTHGELTGTNDAQVVIDALADRSGEPSLVVPDPGVWLEWEQQVDIPAAERGFALLTEGLPTVDIPSGFSGDYMLYKPPTSEPGPYRVGYRIGGFSVFDREVEAEPDSREERIGYGSNENLEMGYYFDDLAQSVIEPTFFMGCPGIHIASSNAYSSNNWIQRPSVAGPRGPAVELANTVGGGRSDQNWVFAPFYNDDTDHDESDTTAFVDRGNDNTWLWTRSEYTNVTHHFDGCENYYVSEGDWDRAHDKSPAIVEVNGAAGIIHGLKNHGSYQYMRLSGLHTDIIGSTNQPSGLTGGKNQPPVSWTVVDLFQNFERAVPANGLDTLGFVDESDDGGSVSIEGGAVNKNPLTFETPASAGGVSQVTMGEGAIQGSMTPKFGVPFAPRGGADSVDTEGVVSRFGFHKNADNRIEFVYDPENELGNHPTGNWYWEIVTEGELRTRTDTGFSPHRRQEFALNREGRSGPGRWSAYVDAYKSHAPGYPGAEGSADVQTMFGPVPADGVTINSMTLRFRVRSLDGDAKRWWIETNRGVRLFVM